MQDTQFSLFNQYSGFFDTFFNHRLEYGPHLTVG